MIFHSRFARSGEKCMLKTEGATQHLATLPLELARQEKKMDNSDTHILLVKSLAYSSIIVLKLNTLQNISKA